MKIKSVLVVVGLVIALTSGVAIFLFFGSDGSGKNSPETNGSRLVTKKTSGKNLSNGSVQKIRERGRKTATSGKQNAVLPQIAFSTPEDDERELNELEKVVLRQIRTAMDDNKLHALRKAIALFYAPASKGGLEGRVPKELRLQAIEALGWFRPDTAADLMSFMADSDEEVVEDAFAKFEMELDDWSLGDRDRAEILVQVMKAMTDSDRIDSLMMNLNNMRNSVKADTIENILEMGTPQAQALMREQIGCYTDTSVETVEDLQKWRESNLDEPTDDEFYGPNKDK